MRKIFLLISTLVFCMFAVFASVTRGGGYTVNTQGLDILAGFGENASIKVFPIASQAQSYLAGMPFNIEESYVAYNSNSSGRLIATWDVIANTYFEIHVECPDLGHETDMSVKLPYHLSFEYSLSYSTDGVNNVDEPLSGSLLVRSGVGEQVFRISDLIEDVSAGFFIGSVSGNVFFQFDEYMQDGSTLVTEYIKNAPSGNYGATVKLRVQVEG